MNNWKDEWKDMPEFVQEFKKPYKELKIRFRNEMDYQEFAELIGQKLTDKTKGIWYPAMVRGLDSHLRFFDES